MTVDPHNKDFQRAFELVANTSRNVFLTGRAGTGKTTFLKYLKENCSKAMAVVAPTGVAAINAGGVTIHSLFQITPGFNDPNAPPAYNLSREKQAVLAGLSLLIIPAAFGLLTKCSFCELSSLKTNPFLPCPNPPDIQYGTGNDPAPLRWVAMPCQNLPAIQTESANRSRTKSASKNPNE